MIDHVAVQLALRSRLLTADGIPGSSQRSWENKDFTPTAGTTFLAEQYVPGPTTLLTTTARGVIECRGLYVVTWGGIANSGITAIRTGVDSILAVFPPGTTITTLANGDVLRVRGNPAPYAGQIIQNDAGRAACTITIPFVVLSTNAPPP